MLMLRRATAEVWLPIFVDTLTRAGKQVDKEIAIATTSKLAKMNVRIVTKWSEVLLATARSCFNNKDAGVALGARGDVRQSCAAHGRISESDLRNWNT